MAGDATPISIHLPRAWTCVLSSSRAADTAAAAAPAARSSVEPVVLDVQRRPAAAREAFACE